MVFTLEPANLFLALFAKFLPGTDSFDWYKGKKTYFFLQICQTPLPSPSLVIRSNGYPQNPEDLMLRNNLQMTIQYKYAKYLQILDVGGHLGYKPKIPKNGCLESNLAPPIVTCLISISLIDSSLTHLTTTLPCGWMLRWGTIQFKPFSSWNSILFREIQCD